MNAFSTQFNDNGYSVALTHSRNLDQLHELIVAHEQKTIMTFEFGREGVPQIEIGPPTFCPQVHSWTEWTENRS